MAGKKKVVDDSHLSKTARASKGKKKDETFIASGDTNRLISLCGGEWAYVLTPDGKTHHVKVGSDRWTALLEVLLADPKFDWKVKAQLESWNGLN